MKIIHYSSRSTSLLKTYGRTAIFLLIGLLNLHEAKAHGSLENSRAVQVRVAGPAGGTPAPWNDSYYNWNENSNNFLNYASPSFAYSDYVPDGSINNAGKNNGVTGHAFSGLNNPSDQWNKLDAQAGAAHTLRFMASAPHDPSYFEVYLTLQSFDVSTTSMGWGDLEYLGRWSIGDSTHPVQMGDIYDPISGSTLKSYDWSITIPEDRSGHHAFVVVWQRVDPAGEAFFATQDIQVMGIPEPSSVALLIGMGATFLALRYRRSKN